MLPTPHGALSLFAKSWQHRSLIVELTKREFASRYRGSFGGILWALLQPLLLLSVYTLAFGVVLRARWSAADSTAHYALMIFPGLIVMNAFAEVLGRSGSLITANPNFVRKIVFPLELLPVATVASAMAHALVATAVWFAGHALLLGHPPAASLLFPVVLACLVPLLLGVAWLMSAAGVVVRDLSQITGIISHSLLFLTPVFYSIESAPPLVQRLLVLNPLTWIVERFRAVVFRGDLPSLADLAGYAGLSCLFAWGSLLVFRRLRPVFADLV